MRFTFLAPLLLGLLAPASAAATSPVSKQPQPAFSSDAANDFDFAMYAKLRTEKGNVFFSAPSLRDALGIAYLGARGATKDEMQKALVFDPDAAKTAAEAKDAAAGWNAARGGAKLAIANRLWTDQTMTVLDPKYEALVKNGYGAAIEPIDFLHAHEASRGTINGWVEKQTNNRIKDLLPEGSIQKTTRVVITNAVWFKGTWATTFDKNGTRPEKFSVDGKTPTDVPTMHQHGHFALARGDGARVLEIPYAKSDLAMDIVLPDANDGLSAVEAKLSRGTFTTWTSHLSQTDVELSLPKFTFSWGGSMIPRFQALGMKTAFDADHADFTGLAKSKDDGRLVIGTIVHKAFVAVDEEGSEAAAATGVAIGVATTSVDRHRPEPFVVDRPFVFVIRDTKRGGILFMGRVTNPS